MSVEEEDSKIALTADTVKTFCSLYGAIENKLNEINAVLDLWRPQYLVGISDVTSDYIYVLTRYPDSNEYDDDYESHAVPLHYLLMSYEELQEEAKKIAQETRERIEREERKQYEMLKEKYAHRSSDGS